MAKEISDKKKQEIDHLTQQLGYMEQKLQEKYSDVGKFIMDRVEKENKEIDHMVNEVIKLKKELVQAKGQIRCPKCYQYNEPDSSYCSRCGEKLEKEKNGKFA